MTFSPKNIRKEDKLKIKYQRSLICKIKQGLSEKIGCNS